VEKKRREFNLFYKRRFPPMEKASIVYTPKQNRPAIVLGWIEEYDGQFVTFQYKHKKDGKEKREKVMVEEFIGRISYTYS
jgi:hypothetical protein